MLPKLLLLRARSGLTAAGPNGSSPFQKYRNNISSVKGWGTNFVLALNFIVAHVNFHSNIYTVYYHLQSHFTAIISFIAVLILFYPIRGKAEQSLVN